MATLFARSLYNLTQVDAGFEPENVLILSVGMAGGEPKGIQAVHIYNSVLEYLTAVPGVRSAALSSEVLFGGSRWTEAITAPGFNPTRGQDREAVMLVPRVWVSAITNRCRRRGGYTLSVASGARAAHCLSPTPAEADGRC
jgi:hypothetical protein